MAHEAAIRVFYEDTDMGGIVYHANYLKFIERARSTILREAGLDQRRLKEEAGIAFVVRDMEADWLAPALLDDELAARTETESVGRATAVLRQTLLRSGAALFRARVRIACLGPTGRPARIPIAARAALAAL